MAWQALFGERATTKFAVIVDSHYAASSVVADLMAEPAGLQASQVRLVNPHEKGFDKKLEPETQGIVRTAMRAHLILGLFGAVIGLGAWVIAYFAGIAALVSSPFFSLSAFAILGAVGGLFLGGLITARPDHQILIQRVKTATNEGKWSVIVHPFTPAQCDSVAQVLQTLGVEVVRTV
ncbi:hypothetical protein [Pusillimonas sp. ANT_WB101]|uniref:hypothetical protein n=1 Tax=Pusillimonas sp. ANT_WB101 TaxID=2597356 RepID=UPI0011EFBCDB|nr:hypothetical protein [Pusillimonas sp. ANT_WB101]KAA0911836.1 hypothetical protein FQ179_08620 [Pusillimonas sp. ANT_WB101]